VSFMALAFGTLGFTVPSGAPGSICRRCASPTMQFFNPKKDAAPPKPSGRGGRRGGDFFDDERDTVSREPWMPEFVENGEEDLATVGGVYYLALVPFVLFFISYVAGGISGPYSSGGNF
jgi:hypothetical protein